MAPNMGDCPVFWISLSTGGWCTSFANRLYRGLRNYHVMWKSRVSDARNLGNPVSTCAHTTWPTAREECSERNAVYRPPSEPLNFTPIINIYVGSTLRYKRHGAIDLAALLQLAKFGGLPEDTWPPAFRIPPI